MRILAAAYACAPDVGSESGAGWAWSRILARFGEVTVLTSSANREEIESALPTLPERDRIRFVYVDAPRTRPYLRGELGVRLHYLDWERRCIPVADGLHRDRPFDVVWQRTVSAVWLGSSLARLGPPLVWGPVGGGVDAPRWALPSMPLVARLIESARPILRSVMMRHSFVRDALPQAALALAQNRETAELLRSRGARNVEVFSAMVLPDDLPELPPLGPIQRRALFVGRLLWHKGAHLAMEAVQRSAVDWTLTVFGSPRVSGRRRGTPAAFELGGRVHLEGRVSRSEVLRAMADADALLFPSLHEEGGNVVVEALAMGLPVVGFAHGGPLEVARVAGLERALPWASDGSPEVLADALERSMSVREVVRKAAPRVRAAFSLEGRTSALAALLDRALPGLFPAPIREA